MNNRAGNIVKAGSQFAPDGLGCLGDSPELLESDFGAVDRAMGESAEAAVRIQKEFIGRKVSESFTNGGLNLLRLFHLGRARIDHPQPQFFVR